MATNPTRTGSTIFGKSVARDLLSLAIGGSILLGGYAIVDRAQTSSVRQYFGTGSYMTYVDAVCTNTGGLAKYTSCIVSNPFTGTGVIQRVQVDAYKAPNASPITCTTTQVGSTTATGANVLIRYAATASGRTLAFTHTGSGSGVGSVYAAPLLLPNASIRCWHSTTPGTALKERLRVWINEQYIP